MNLKDYVYNIESFDEKGKSHKDLTPIFENGEAFKEAVSQLTKFSKKLKPDLIVSPESKGFILGAAVASKLGIGFVPVRNPKNLTREFAKSSYSLETGVTKELACHSDAIKKNYRIVIIDDKLSTGNTLITTIRLIERLGGNVVGCAALLELTDKNGREKLKDYNVISLIEDTSAIK